ncbi:MAG: hypothetical protein ACLQO1_17045 [Steroidobacteraceae bacterium]
MRGFPKGALLVIGVEFWERFSFYGMLAILALFLTASPTHGGFGWPATEALALVGAYSGAMYALPADTEKAIHSLKKALYYRLKMDDAAIDRAVIDTPGPVVAQGYRLASLAL